MNSLNVFEWETHKIAYYMWLNRFVWLGLGSFLVVNSQIRYEIALNGHISPICWHTHVDKHKSWYSILRGQISSLNELSIIFDQELSLPMDQNVSVVEELNQTMLMQVTV